MRKLPALVLIVGVLIVALVVFVTVHSVNGYKAHQNTVAGFPALSREEMASADEAGNVLPATEVLHIFGIQDKVARSHDISNEDLDWLLNKLRTNSNPGERKQLARVRILEPIKALKNISTQQRDKIFEAVLPMLSDDPNFSDPLDKTQASTIMRIINDKRAVPYLVPLLTNSDDQVRAHAQHALNVIGYKKT